MRNIPSPLARGVHHHPVEKAGQAPPEILRGHIAHQGVCHPHALHVLAEHPGPGGMDLVCHQKPLVFHGGGQIGGLAPRGGAQIQHPLSRSGPGQHPYSHGGRLLDVVKAPFVEGMQPRPGRLFIIKPFRAPFHRRQGKGQNLPQLLGRDFQGVGPQSQMPPLLLILGKQLSGLLFSQKTFHPFFESYRQLHGSHLSSLGLNQCNEEKYGSSVTLDPIIAI